MSALRIALQQTLILPDIRKYGSILHAQEATLRRHFHYCKIRCKHVRRVRNPGRPLTAKDRTAASDRHSAGLESR